MHPVFVIETVETSFLFTSTHNIQHNTTTTPIRSPLSIFADASHGNYQQIKEVGAS
jgi:hypothetical protein